VNLSFEEKRAILMFARRYPLLGKARADEIAASYAAQRVSIAVQPGGAADDEGPSPSACLLGVARALENGV
jgi:hypothetical protein